MSGSWWGRACPAKASISSSAESYITDPPSPPDRMTHVIYHTALARQRGGGGEPSACDAVSSCRRAGWPGARCWLGERRGRRGRPERWWVLVGAGCPLPALLVENEQNRTQRHGPGLTGTVRVPWAVRGTAGESPGSWLPVTQTHVIEDGCSLKKDGWRMPGVGHHSSF